MTLSGAAASGAVLRTSDITSKPSLSRVRHCPGERQDLGCEASGGRRQGGRKLPSSRRQQGARPLPVGGSIDTEGEGVNAGHVNAQDGLQGAELRQPLELGRAWCRARGWQYGEIWV